MLCGSYERPFMLRRLAALSRSGMTRMAAINPTTKVKGARALIPVIELLSPDQGCFLLP